MKSKFHTSPIFYLLILISTLSAQSNPSKTSAIDLNGFWDSAHHWYDINDEVPKLISPQPDQKKYKKNQITEIADNILLYQRSNGGWPKNYDMQAILTEEQQKKIIETKNDISLTTFDNGSTHSQIEYLARAYEKTNDERYKDAALRGIDFILSAQYPNGGFPQFFPDTSGYRKYITFNDGAMGGVMKVLGEITFGRSYYSFVDLQRREKIRSAFEKGIDCILQCQIKVNDTLTAWCQQHDNVDLRPQNARAFEPKAICSQESAELVLFLMSIDHPAKETVTAINSAVSWFNRSAIAGIRVETVKAEKTKYMYHTTDEDKIVVQDKAAPPIWARMYEIETNRPLFCNRDKKIVYSLAEVERERRTGYKWYGYEPQEVIQKYPAWQAQWSPDTNVLK